MHLQCSIRKLQKNIKKDSLALMAYRKQTSQQNDIENKPRLNAADKQNKY